jgi:Mitochondrial carrier protein
MQADGRLPPAQRRGYTNIFNALRRIASEEGVLTYWRGASPTVTRAMVVSMTQLGTYDQIKSMLLPHTGDTAQTHVISALTAAVVYSLASLPVSAVCTAQLCAVYEMQCHNCAMFPRMLVQPCSDAAVTAHRTVTADTYINQHV